MQQIAFHAMGCEMQALIDADTPEGATALGQAPGWFESWEQTLSRFRADSELSRLNGNRGQTTPASLVLWEVVDLALAAARASEGLVNPALLPALEAAGYDRSFDALDKLGTEAQTELAWRPLGPAPRPEHVIARDSQARTLRLADGVRLDLGGVAKGWAADEAARRLGAYGPTLVDAGGDISVSAPRSAVAPWTVGVANPFFPDETLETLLVTSRAGVATSGRDYRRWQRGGRWYHHILDPRSGRPAETDVLTATVVAASAAQAEVAAKVALILGSEKGRAWIEARPELAAVLVLDDGRVLRTDSLAAYVPVAY